MIDMTRTELLETLANGENSGVEFRRDDLSPQDLAGELVAFSNLEGGMVVLGVEDDGTVSGLTRPPSDLEEWARSVCRDKIRPPIVPFFTTMREFEDDKDIAIVRVSRGYNVHALRHDNAERYLIRFGTRSLDPRPEELDQLFRRGRATRVELQPVSGTAIEHLDRRRLRNCFRDIRELDLPADHDEDAWRFLLSNTWMMAEGCVTVGGLLLFGSTPNRFLPHAGISAAAYPGTDKDCAARERAALRGPITPLLDANGDLVEAGLVEQALEFVRRNAPGSVAIEDGAGRAERSAYPDEVLREAVVNALVHRDYLLADADIELSVYSDRLEVASPGCLPSGITPDRMRLGTRTTRNELLKAIMDQYRYYRCSENAGPGGRRIIIEGMREHNGTEPGLIEQDERFIVRLSAKAPDGESEA